MKLNWRRYLAAAIQSVVAVMCFSIALAGDNHYWVIILAALGGVNSACASGNLLALRSDHQFEAMRTFCNDLLAELWRLRQTMGDTVMPRYMRPLTEDDDEKPKRTLN